MSRENARAKGVPYLGEGRLTVLHVDPERIRAECRSAGAVYRLGYKDGTWRCSCPALTTCAHLHALMAVTVRGAAA